MERTRSSPSISASRSSGSEAPASCSARTRTAKTASSTQAPATVREVESRLSSPISGARRPPRARWKRAAAVSSPAVMRAAISPAVRAVDQPAPIAVRLAPTRRAPAAPQTANSVPRQTWWSQASPASRARSATVRADPVSSSDTHCREAEADWATPAGSPLPAASSSRLARNAATARRCPWRAPCGQSPHVQPPLCMPLVLDSSNATEDYALSRPGTANSLAISANCAVPGGRCPHRGGPRAGVVRMFERSAATGAGS